MGGDDKVWALGEMQTLLANSFNLEHGYHAGCAGGGGDFRMPSFRGTVSPVTTAKSESPTV